jgi:pilus assembly protein CpaB
VAKVELAAQPGRMGLRMNKRVLVILLSAFVVAAACSYFVYSVVGKRLMAQQNTRRVIVAATDIKLGSLLRDVDLETSEMANPLPKGVMVDRKDVVGRGVISNLYQGEPIMESRLAAAGSGGGLAATISQGMRACAVKVDDVVGVAGFVTAGMRVDVLISGNPPGAVNPSEGPKVKTLLQNIQVLSAGTDIQKDGEGKPKQVQVVNLLVTPEQAEVLSLASNQTHIQLVLRNPLDTQISQPPGTAMANLFADKNVAPPKPRSVVVARAIPKPTARVYLIQVFNGSKRTEEKFVTNEGK